MSKYGNKKTQMHGILFDSKAEAARYAQLIILERTGNISKLERQVAYQIVPGVKLWGAKRARPAMRIVVDFRYVENGAIVLEDTKGMETPLSLAKRHLMKALHGLDVRTTK